MMMTLMFSGDGDGFDCGSSGACKSCGDGGGGSGGNESDWQ